MTCWTRVAPVDDVPSGTGREFVVDGRIVAVFNVDGLIHAIDGICPHQGGPLGKGALTGCVVTCPWHGFQFNVVDGRHLTSRQLAQPVFSAKVEDGEIYIALGDT